jgi:hypothetical protein
VFPTGRPEGLRETLGRLSERCALAASTLKNQSSNTCSCRPPTGSGIAVASACTTSTRQRASRACSAMSALRSILLRGPWIGQGRAERTVSEHGHPAGGQEDEHDGRPQDAEDHDHRHEHRYHLALLGRVTCSPLRAISCRPLRAAPDLGRTYGAGSGAGEGGLTFRFHGRGTRSGRTRCWCFSSLH